MSSTTSDTTRRSSTDNASLSQLSTDEVGNSNKKNKKINKMNKINLDAMKEMIKQNTSKIQSKWRKLVTGNERKRIRDHLREKEEQPNYIKFFDKLAFTFGVLNILICQYFLLNIPEYFSIWYSFVIPIILLSRFYHFRSLNWHYFLIDFCYFINLSTLLNLFFLRSSSIFFKICFIHATGTLPIAILIWRNSLVFHDYDKIVSVYIHILPCMLYYTLRWYNNSALINGSIQVCDPSTTLLCNLTIKDYLLAILFYLFWQIIYIYKTEVLDLEKFNKNPDLLTSLRWMSKDTKNPLARKVLSFLQKIGIFHKTEDYDSTSMKTKLVFVASQFFITVISLLPSYFIFNSSRGHLLYIGLIFFSSMFNGASFYIEVFSVRYHSSLEKLEKMHKIALEANTVMKQIVELREKQGQETAKNLENNNTTNDVVKGEGENIVKEDEVDHLTQISDALHETTSEALKHINEHTRKLLLEHPDDSEAEEGHLSDEIAEGEEVQEGEDEIELERFDDESLEKYLLNIEDDDDLNSLDQSFHDSISDHSEQRQNSCEVK